MSTKGEISSTKCPNTEFISGCCPRSSQVNMSARYGDTCWMLKSGINTDTVSSQVSASPSIEQSRGLRAASTNLWAGSRPSLQMMTTSVRELQVLLQVARCCRMQSAEGGASAQVMITADLTCRPRGDAATAPVVISRCHNNCDYAQGAITLHSDLKYDNDNENQEPLSHFCSF